MVGTTGKRSCCATIPVIRWPAEDRRRDVLVEAVLHLRLVVEQIEMRRSAGLEQEDDALRARRESWKRPAPAAAMRLASPSSSEQRSRAEAVPGCVASKFAAVR